MIAQVAASPRARILPISAHQAEALQATEPVVGYVGGRGAGKTWVGAYKILSRSKPGWPWLCVSPDAGVVYDTTLPTFLEIAQQLGVYRKHVVSPYPRVWWQAGGDGDELAQVVFRSGEKPDKLRGPNKAGLWIDEASIQSEDVYLIARATLRHRGRMGQTLLTMTPRGRNHWTFKVFYERIEPGQEEAAIADGSHEIIQGIAYRRRVNRCLVQASTRDNPFLPAEFYAEQKSAYSQILAEQELEGRFIDIEGLMFQRHWFPVVDSAPKAALRVRYWDKAASVIASSSYTAGVLIARSESGEYFIEDVVRGQWTPAERDTVIYQTAVSDARLHQNSVMIYMEQEGGSGGKEVMQQAIRKLAGFPIYRDLPSKGQKRNVGGVVLPGNAKITRAQPLAAQAQAGNVKLVSGEWNSEFLSELCAFPESSHADQVDAAAAGLNRLAALARPTDLVAEKSRVSGGTDRFGKALAPADMDTGPARRKLFGRS